VNVVNQLPVAVFVGKQTRRSEYHFVAFQRRYIVEPDTVGDQRPDVGDVQSVWVVAPARKVAVLSRRELGAYSVDVEAPRTVPSGRVMAAAARCPRLHTSTTSSTTEHLLVRLTADQRNEVEMIV